MERRANSLEHLVCFDLYTTSRAVTALYRPLLTELGLTYPQYLVLLLLHDEGPVPISAVSRHLRLDHGTLTPLLRRLETAGLVSRTRGSADERVVTVALTARGEEVHARFGDVQCRVAEAMELTADEAATLQKALRRLETAVS